jgi:hyperosmotically inducible periplasmic protein
MLIQTRHVKLLTKFSLSYCGISWCCECLFSLREYFMNPSKKIAVTCVAVAALFVAGNASAQTDSGDAASSTQQPKKAIRAENRQLSMHVRHALDKTKDLTASGITVLARGGAVTLDGTVPTEDQIQLAADTASHVTGVKSVKNNLTVREEGH